MEIKKSQRMDYAIKLLLRNGIEYQILDERIYHIVAWTRKYDIPIHFYASTGKIDTSVIATFASEKTPIIDRGVHNLVRYVKEF